MAGTVVHLLIAKKLSECLAKTEWRYPFARDTKMNTEYFIAGNICPDGIMARSGYRRKMKLHTHFRDGIPDGSFDKPGMIPLFEQRMHDFWQEHQEDEIQCPGLYLGYITHMMTDERFVLEERPKFFEQIAPSGLTKKDKETFLIFNKETDLVDFKLLRNFPELEETKEVLERVSEYEIKGMITRQELTASRQWILQHFFYEEHSTEEPEYLQYENMVEFVAKMTEEIIRRLFTEGFLEQ
ncbi:MAG: hypothetical protein SO170_05150 [Butyribacter sp.]|nr:hypothetical protein [bacterium]MDY3854336.1 hypothetical protein [Butyribacter sp.]